MGTVLAFHSETSKTVREIQKPAVMNGGLFLSVQP
jgi:hypothetical protein